MLNFGSHCCSQKNIKAMHFLLKAQRGVANFDNARTNPKSQNAIRAREEVDTIMKESQSGIPQSQSGTQELAFSGSLIK
jgi:hypothetical protein